MPAPLFRWASILLFIVGTLLALVLRKQIRALKTSSQPQTPESTPWSASPESPWKNSPSNSQGVDDMNHPITQWSYGENFTKWDDKFEHYANMTMIPMKLVKAICMVESSLGNDPRVRAGLLAPYDIANSSSEDGKSWGLMQMTVRCAKDYDPAATAEMMNFPDISIKLACQHLRRLSHVFLGIEEWIVKAYNQGEGATLLEKCKHTKGNADEYWNKYKQRKAILQ